ncbi:MAG TPA: TIGR01459 family HAD-type hydrolase, partial [Methylocella sp.]|nr:TIGR01459 family HAD-type hydrolase [Methylocella sp.]
MTRLVGGLSALAGSYQIIFCDVWGVIHDGVQAFAKAAEALRKFRAQGGKAVLLTNS